MYYMHFAVIPVVPIYFLCINIYIRIKGKFQGQMRPKMGAPKMMDEEMEGDIALFVKHMELLRIPVTREKLKMDIVHFCKEHRRTFPRMPIDGPGELMHKCSMFACSRKTIICTH